MSPDRLQKLLKLLGVTTIKKDIASQQQVTLILHQILGLLDEADKVMATEVMATNKGIESLKIDLQGMSSEHAGQMDSHIAMCDQKLQDIKSALTTLVEEGDKKLEGEIVKSSDKWYKDLNNEVYKLEKLIREVPQFNPSVLENKWALVIDELSKRIVEVKPFILSAIDVRDSLETLEGDERLDKSAIKGIEVLEKKITAIELRPVSKGGVAGGNMQIYVDGVLKGTSRYVNFIAGTGMTLTPAFSGERTDILFDATGGGGLTQLTATGAVDGSNTTFTFVSKPTYIIQDGAWQRENFGWTWAGLTATMSVPPQADIYGLA